VLSAQGDWRVV
jgi:hypothetical protein